MSPPNLSNQHELKKLIGLSKKPWLAGNDIFKEIHDHVLVAERQYQELPIYRDQLTQQSKHFKTTERRWANICLKYAYINDDKKALACLMRRTAYKDLNIEIYEQIIQQAILVHQVKRHLLFLKKKVIFLVKFGNNNIPIEELEEMNDQVIAGSNNIDNSIRTWKTSMTNTQLSKQELVNFTFTKFVESIEMNNVSSSLKKELKYMKKRLTVLNGKLVLDKRW